MNRDDRRAEESRRIFDRIERESEAGGRRSYVARGAERVRGHMVAADADQNDSIELWGTRIGRALGLILFVGLVTWLLSIVLRGG